MIALHEIKGDYVKFASFVLDVSDEEKTRFFFVQFTAKQLLDSAFCDIQEVSGYQ